MSSKHRRRRLGASGNPTSSNYPQTRELVPAARLPHFNFNLGGEGGRI